MAVYDPYEYFLGDKDEIDAFELTRLRNVVTLIRTQFLKRFESSVYAFETSCDRLLRKLLAFLEKHCETAHERSLLDRWVAQHESVLNYSRQKQMELWGDTEDDDPELFPEELLEQWEKLDRKKFDVAKIINVTLLDLNELVQFLNETRKFKPERMTNLKSY